MAIKGISNLTSKVKVVVASQAAKNSVSKLKVTGTITNKASSKAAGIVSAKKSSRTSTTSTKKSSKTSTSSVKTSNKMVTANGKVTSKTNTQSTKTGSKTSTQSAKTSSTTSQESGQIVEKPTTYVTGAAAIYTSSGSVSAYACGVTMKQSRKDSSESCMSCNRPSASYPDQLPQSKSVKTDKSKKATYSTSSKPVSPAVPKKKADTKKASTTKKKSAPIKEYMPSDSRNGAGKVFYRKKTTPSGAKEGASFLISLVPGVGDAKDIQEAITGKDWVTGKKLSKTDRLTTAASTGIPIISGSSVRVVKSGIKYGNKVTKKTVKRAVWKGSSKSEKSTKVVKKALGKGTKKSDDVKKKAVSKLKKGTKDIGKTDTGKKTVKKSGDSVKIKESGVKKKEEAAGKVHKDGVVSKGGNNSINGFSKNVNAGRQGKHILGNNNYIEGRSIFNGTVNDAQKLVDEFAGTGEWIGQNKERVNFGKVIGKYVNPSTGESVDTTVGMIHYSKTGTHIVPAQLIE